MDQNELVTPIVEDHLMTRMYNMGGMPMRRGLVPFGERVLVVAYPDDDHTPQHIVTVGGDGEASYLRADGTFAPVPESGTSPHQPAILRGEGLEADYADGLLALLNSDSLSDWTDSGFLDWGSGATPTDAPPQWDTRVPLIWRESHQRTVAVLGPDAGQSGSLVVGHVSRLFQDAEGRQPVYFPSAMVSTNRGRTWKWGPQIDGVKTPAGAYAAAWPDAPGGGIVLYFIVTLPGDDITPPLVSFRPDASSDTGVAMHLPYTSPSELWAGHGYTSSGHSFVPSPIRHWVTRWGLILETTTQGLFWMDRPDSLPKRIGDHKQGLESPARTLYFATRDELMRVLPTGGIERLVDPDLASWEAVGEIERPVGTDWVQAAASAQGALWLLGRLGSDISIATSAPGTAF